MLESLLASVLATMLGMLLATSCATFGRPALEVDARARIAQEGILAAQSIACDLGGFVTYSSSSGQKPGTSTAYAFTGWDLSQGSVLFLNYQGATSNDSPVTVTYQVIVDPVKPSANRLVRYDSLTGVWTTIATGVTAFTVEPNPDNPSQALIQITVAFRYFTSTFTLIGVPPT